MIRSGLSALAIIVGGMLATAPAKAGEPPYPAADRTWSEHDYVSFYFTHFNGNLALPHLRDETNKAIFDRLVAGDNIARLARANAPPEEKLADMRLLLSALGEIRASYNSAVIVGEPLAEELTRVQIFTLAALDDAVALSKLAARSPSRAWTTTFFGVVTSLSEQQTYSASERLAMSDAIARHFPELRVLLSEHERQDLCDRIGAIAANESDPALRKSYSMILSLSSAP
jgi:hypothetical protein